MADTILLTGANGFLGSHIARQLLARGYVVRALLRPGSNRETLNDLPIDVVEGDLNNPDDVVRATANCAGIIHAAALAQVNPARNPAVWAANLTGTEHVLQAAKAHQVRRLVYVGTANVFGFAGIPLLLVAHQIAVKVWHGKAAPDAIPQLGRRFNTGNGLAAGRALAQGF